jgi:hypothetical protein
MQDTGWALFQFPRLNTTSNSDFQDKELDALRDVMVTCMLWPADEVHEEIKATQAYITLLEQRRKSTPLPQKGTLHLSASLDACKNSSGIQYSVLPLKRDL